MSNLEKTINHACFVARVYSQETTVKLNNFNNEILSISSIEGDNLCCTLTNAKGEEMDSACFSSEGKKDVETRILAWVDRTIESGETIQSILDSLKNQNARVLVTFNHDNGIATDALNNTYDYTGGDHGYALWNEHDAYRSDGKEMWLANENDLLEVNEKLMIVRNKKWCFLANL